MTTRIRYVKNGNLLVSKKLLTGGNGELLSVSLNTTKLTFTVTGQSGETVLTGNAPNLASLKINARGALISLGVVLEVEQRRGKRGTTISLTEAAI